MYKIDYIYFEHRSNNQKYSIFVCGPIFGLNLIYSSIIPYKYYENPYQIKKNNFEK